MQSVFLEIFRSVAQFDSAKGTTKVWILQYAYHRALNRRQHLNARNFHNQTNLREIETHLPEAASTLGGFTQHELKHLLRQGLATLNSPQEQVVELVSYNGLDEGDRRQDGRLSIECKAPLLPGTSETAFLRGKHAGEGKDSGQR
jgi:RNA polymerase sigma-70 factor, ECF subfamily